MTAVEFDLTHFAQRLAGLESEINRKPALRCFLDADLDHNLSALRFMGILDLQSAPVTALPSELRATVKHNHGGSRQNAGRKKSRSNANRQRAYRRRVTALRKSSL